MTALLPMVCHQPKEAKSLEFEVSGLEIVLNWECIFSKMKVRGFFPYINNQGGDYTEQPGNLYESPAITAWST